MKKKTSGVIIGKVKKSEFSDQNAESDFEQPIILKIYSRDIDFDFDLDNNATLKNLNNFAIEGKKLLLRFEETDVVTEKDIRSTIEYVVNSLESIIMTTKQYIINSEKIKLLASENILLGSREIMLGQLEDIEELEEGNEENFEYDYIVTKKKLERWWGNNIKPFVNKIDEFIKKYNLHSHGGMVPPPVSEDGVRNFKEPLENSQTTDKLIASKTTKAL
jgi:hypothetical protein